jgi:hypothetical protein
MLARLLLAGLLLAHAGIHAGFLSAGPSATADGPAWPFQLDRSWALDRLGVDAGTRRVLALALVAVTLAGFALAALAVVQLVPADLWVPAATIGSLGSIGLLVLFFHRWLVLGLAIDVAILIAVRALDWAPSEGL